MSIILIKQSHSFIRIIINLAYRLTNTRFYEEYFSCKLVFYLSQNLRHYKIRCFNCLLLLINDSI